MTSYSDRPGFCSRCGCANGNHTIQRCGGRVKEGKKWVPCQVEWSRCTTGGHSSHSEDVKFVDCFRCRDHPGAPPDDFWGTQPDDDDEEKIPTADDLDIPLPGLAGSWEPAAAPGGHSRTLSVESDDPLQSGQDSTQPRQTKTSKRRHGRTLSTESLDPLQSGQDWTDPDGIPSEESDPMIALAQEFGEVGLHDDDRPYYVETLLANGNVYFTDAGGNNVGVDVTRWIQSSIEYEGEAVPCFMYADEHTVRQYYTWEFGDGGSSVKGKGKSKGSRREGKGKNKRH